MVFLDSPVGFSRLLKKASLVGAFFVSACWLPFSHALCPAPAALPSARVERVVDGDTLRLVDGRSVRMIGLNAPETGKKGQTAEPFAEAAKRRLQSLVDASDGEVLLRVGVQDKDHYGRTLANVYGRDGANLEAQLLAEGLGYMIAIAPNTTLVECQQAAERSARSTAQGLWRNPPVRAANAIATGGFALVSGKVSDVQRNRGGVWLSLGSALVVRIAPEQLGLFSDVQLTALKGRQVEVRGWVIDRSRKGGLRSGQQRWMLPITHPAMLLTR